MKIDKIRLVIPPLFVNDDHFDYNYYSENDQESSEDDVDALSLSNLSLGNNDDENDVVSNNENSYNSEDYFEFSTTTTTESSSSSSLESLETFSSDDNYTTVLFCGKSIPCRSSTSKPINSLPQTTSSSQFLHHATSSSDHHHSSVFSWTRSASRCNKAQSCRFNNVRTTTTTSPPLRSSSLRLPDTENSRCRQHKSNSNTNSRGRSWSRMHNVLFGLARLPSRMELTEIRKRQSRRVPVSMFAALSCGDKPVVSSSEKGHWSVLRFRSNLLSALARLSFGCFRHV